MTAWILILTIGSGWAEHAYVVSGIESEAECRALHARLVPAGSLYANVKPRCIEYRTAQQR